MKTKSLMRLLLLGIIIATVGLSSCGKDDDSDPGDSQDNGVFKDARDGKEYNWVKIGAQIWMAENLAYTGNDIQHIMDNDIWHNNANLDAWCYYDNDENNAGAYGVLYQWEAAIKACPDGWHLPNDAEWIKLEQFVESDGHSGNAGAALKSETGWNSGNGTDNYGFAALPGGVRNDGGDFYNLGNYGIWWTATETDSDNAKSRGMSYNDTGIGRYGYTKSHGFSVRCVKN